MTENEFNQHLITNELGGAVNVVYRNIVNGNIVFMGKS